VITLFGFIMTWGSKRRNDVMINAALDVNREVWDPFHIRDGLN
jgi:hypothetical protein